MFRFLRNLHTVLHSDCTNLHSYHRVIGFPFLHSFTSIYCLQIFFYDGHSDQCEVILHCRFYFYEPKHKQTHRHREQTCGCKGGGKEKDWESGISRCKLLYTEWIKHFSNNQWLSIFSCALWPSVCLLWRNVYLDLALTFDWIICFFIFS